jgi:beta-phosphoglucomutase-like phosphatase (HAD superfamily)
VVENAPLGVAAAVAARCFTIAVNTGPLPDEVLLSQGADIIFPTMPAFSNRWNELYNNIKSQPSNLNSQL